MDKWEVGKQEHLNLSAVAADHYDELYEKANFATGSYMRYELDTIGKFISSAPSSSIAVDLGCGTGRDSFLIAKHFTQVYAYDFSPEMIRVANKNKIRKRAGNILFETKDIEDGPLSIVNESIPFVNSAFGMGSFIKTPETLFREVRRILQPKGISVFSFYNSESLVNQLELDWRPALAARPVPGEHALDVDFDGTKYRISARAYTVKEIERKLRGNFKIIEITTFPTLSSLFPQSLFKNDIARQLCTRVDQLLSNNLDIAAGPYIIAVCQKGGSFPKTKPPIGYEKVLELLRMHDIAVDIREHEPVHTMHDVEKILDGEPIRKLVKSILIACDKPDSPSPISLNADLFLMAIPADRKLHMGKVAKFLERPREQLRFASQIEVEELTGFKVGSIPPFGLPKNIPVILDRDLTKESIVWCGTGKATESLRLSVENLKKLSAYTVADLSKPSK